MRKLKSLKLNKWIFPLKNLEINKCKIQMYRRFCSSNDEEIEATTVVDLDRERKLSSLNSIKLNKNINPRKQKTIPPIYLDPNKEVEEVIKIRKTKKEKPISLDKQYNRNLKYTATFQSRNKQSENKEENFVFNQFDTIIGENIFVSSDFSTNLPNSKRKVLLIYTGGRS